MIKILQLKTESKQRNYRTSDLATETTSKTNFGIARDSSYTRRIQSLISDHIVKSTTVRIV